MTLSQKVSEDIFFLVISVRWGDYFCINFQFWKLFQQHHCRCPGTLLQCYYRRKTISKPVLCFGWVVWFFFLFSLKKIIYLLVGELVCKVWCSRTTVVRLFISGLTAVSLSFINTYCPSHFRLDLQSTLRVQFSKIQKPFLLLA